MVTVTGAALSLTIFSLQLASARSLTGNAV
jgi:uncharacterized membrane protein